MLFRSEPEKAFDWIITRKIFGVDLTEPDKVLESSTESSSEKSLGVDLTRPEKAFDWIIIRKIFRSRFN